MYKNLDSGDDDTKVEEGEAISESDRKVWVGEAISETVIVKVGPAIEREVTKGGNETSRSRRNETEVLLRMKKAVEEGLKEGIQKATPKESKEKESEQKEE